MSGKRMFEFVEGSSSKFWEVWRDGTNVFTRYGRIGSNGQTTIKDEGSDAKAEKLYDKLVREKTGKGYVEKTGGAAAAPEPVDDDVDDDDDDDDEKEETAAPEVAAGEFRRFEFSEGGSNKFWEIRVDGAAHTVRFGKIGTAGQEKTKDFGSDGEAKKDADKLVAEKTKKGYAEVAGGGGGPPVPPLDAGELERHLKDLPRLGDDPGPYLVFADWLLGQGHPWGQLIMLQHGMATDAKKHAALQKDEAALLRQSGSAIVGNLLRHKHTRFVWHYGFIRQATLGSDGTPAGVTTALTTLRGLPAARMVESVVFQPVPKDFSTHQDWDDSTDDIVDPWTDLLSALPGALPDGVDHVGFGGWPAPAASAYVRMPNLAKVSKALPKLRVLELTGNSQELGKLDLPSLTSLTVRFADATPELLDAVLDGKMPKIEQLSVWIGGQAYCTVDSVIEYDYDADEDDGGYPARFSAADLEAMEVDDVNAHVDANQLSAFLGRQFPPTLKRLGINAATLDEKNLDAIAGGKIIASLEALDLSGGTLNDDRTAILIKHKNQLQHLKVIDVSRNKLGKEGVKKLEAAFPGAIVANDQREYYPEFCFRYTATME